MTKNSLPQDRSAIESFSPNPTDRLVEVAETLAAGILRLRARHRTLEGSHREPVSLDFSTERSGHVAPSETRRKRYGRT